MSDVRLPERSGGRRWRTTGLRVILDGIPIWDVVGSRLSRAAEDDVLGQPESLILAQNERWRHA